MTTIASFFAPFRSQKLLLFFGLLFCTSGVFAQLDSASVSLNMTTGPDPEDTTVTIDLMEVEITVSDIDFLGEIIVTAYDAGTDYPLAMIKYTKQEANDAGIVSGNILTPFIYFLESAGSYRIETQVRNYQGANLPMMISDYN